jgi:hypothetical protein
MLCPLEVNGPEELFRLGPVTPPFNATIELLRLLVEPVAAKIPPPFVETLDITVLLVMFKRPAL